MMAAMTITCFHMDPRYAAAGAAGIRASNCCSNFNVVGRPAFRRSTAQETITAPRGDGWGEVVQ